MDHQQHRDRPSRKKSTDRLNDQLIPKPTEVNVADKMWRSVTLKEHPYSSHMSRFAVFPSFLPSDDPDSRFRSTSQVFLDSCVPNRVQNVILLSKTKGNPYRHEIMEAPVKTKKMMKREKELDYTKFKKGESQVFYSTSTKPNFPSLKQHDWYLSKSTRNMLQSLQNKLWRTSYQVDYTGILPANHGKMVNFDENTSNINGINPSSKSLVKSSFSVSPPSNAEPRSVRRPGHKGGNISNISPTKSGARDISPTPNQNTGVMNQHGSQEITSIHGDVPFPNQIDHTQVQRRTCCTEERHSELFPAIPHKHRAQNKSPAQESCKDWFDENLMQESKSQRSQEGNAAQSTDTEWCCQPVLSKNRSSHVEFLSGWSLEEEEMTERRELQHSVSSPCSFPSVLQRTGSGNKPRPVAGAGSTVNLLELQNSFSKSEAHRNFNSSVTRTVMNLRDNVTSGKKHNFYGINCNYIHG